MQIGAGESAPDLRYGYRIPILRPAAGAGKGALVGSFANVGIDGKFAGDLQSSEAREGESLICDAC